MIVALMLLSASSIAEEVTWYTRIDSNQGSKMVFHIWQFAKHLEVGVLDVEAEHPIVEVGAKHLTLDGKYGYTEVRTYGSFWSSPRDFFIEPWIDWRKDIAKGWLADAHFGGYIPITGGDYSFFIKEAGIAKTIGRGCSVGLATTTWLPEGSSAKFPYGITFHCKDLAARALPFGSGPTNFRLEIIF